MFTLHPREAHLTHKVLKMDVQGGQVCLNKPDRLISVYQKKLLSAEKDACLKAVKKTCKQQALLFKSNV